MLKEDLPVLGTPSQLMPQGNVRAALAIPCPSQRFMSETRGHFKKFVKKIKSGLFQCKSV